MRISGDQSSLDDALAVARKSWQHEDTGTSIASDADPKQKEFYRILAETTAPQGWLSLPVLYASNRPIAFQYNLAYEGVTYHLKAGFDRDHARLAPGALLNIAVLQKMIADGHREYDFAGNAGQHKLQWSRTFRDHCKLVVFSQGHWQSLRYGLV